MCCMKKRITIALLLLFLAAVYAFEHTHVGQHVEQYLQEINQQPEMDG